MTADTQPPSPAIERQPPGASLTSKGPWTRPTLSVLPVAAATRNAANTTSDGVTNNLLAS